VHTSSVYHIATVYKIRFRPLPCATRGGAPGRHQLPGDPGHREAAEHKLPLGDRAFFIKATELVLVVYWLEHCTHRRGRSPWRRVCVDRASAWTSRWQRASTTCQWPRASSSVSGALLKDSKVVVLDEATDAPMQQTIQQTFAAETVLICAHCMYMM
jgi:hypothetical protein